MYVIQENKSLREYNSFGIEVATRRFITFETGDDLHTIFADLPSNEPWMVLSGGNNVLFTEDFPGTVLHPIGHHITPLREDDQNLHVRVDAGVEWDNFVEWAVQHELSGIENLSLIPGYTGAAPVQNIGAYGAEAKDTITGVTCFMTDSGEVVHLSHEACRFGYRESIFKRELRDRAIILSVEFVLSRRQEFHLRYGDLSKRVEELGGASLHTIRQAVIVLRNEKLPDPKVLGNAGSFFKNPMVSPEHAAHLLTQYSDMPHYSAGKEGVKLAAGWLIDRCAWRGVRRGAVGVHDKQALVLVNYGGATGNDILNLAHEIQADVAARFGVTIEMEVNRIINL